MVKIVLSEDCGNSPKNQFAADMTVALAQGDIEFTLSRVTDNFRWEAAGSGVLRGKAAFSRGLDPLNEDPVEQLAILHALTHGKAGAVNGTKVLRSGKKIAYCLVFEFDGARAAAVQGITSYEIEIS